MPTDQPEPNLPHSHEAEQGLICCLLNDPRLIPTAVSKLPAECFHHFQTQLVYQAIVHLHKRFVPIEPVSLIAYLRDTDGLERIGGTSAVMELLTYLPIPAQFDRYTEMLLEKHSLRQIIAAAGSIVALTRNPDTNAAGVLEHAVTEFQRLAQSRLNTADMLPCRSINAIIDDVINKADERARNPGRIPGVTSGFSTIDQYTGGQQEGRLWVVAGETSDGKSTLVQNFIEAGCSAGAFGAMYSYEMPDTECAERLLCSRGPLDASEFMMGQFTNGGQNAMTRAMREIKEWRLAILDVSDATIEQICRDITLRAASLRKSDPAARFIAAIDYLQLANTMQRFDNRERAVAHISKTAKQCAKANKITIHMPSQLNDDGKLRESRAIAHDADVVLVIRKPKDSKKDDLSNKREIFCAKNRGGKRNWTSLMTLEGKNFRFNTL